MKWSGVLFGLLVAAAMLAAAGATTTLMLVRAGELRREARELDRAVLLAQTVIETVKAGGTPDDAVHADDLTATSEVLDDGDGLYVLTVTVWLQDGSAVLTRTATIYRGGVI